MTVAQTDSQPRVQAAASPDPPRNGRWSGFRHLLMARMLELKREPEVIFWVFVFPLLLPWGWASHSATSRLTSRRSRLWPARARTGCQTCCSVLRAFLDSRRM